MLGRGAEPGGDQEGADFVAVQAGGVGLVVQPRTADMDGGGVLEQLLPDGVLVEPRDGAQPSSHGSPGPAGGLQVAAEALDVRAAHAEQPQPAVMAPGRELPQVQRVGLAGQAGVPGQEIR